MAKYNKKADRWVLEFQQTTCAAWEDWRLFGFPDPAEVAKQGRRVKDAGGSGEWFVIDRPNATIFAGTYAPDRPPGDPRFTIATVYSRASEFEGAVGVWQSMPAKSN